MILNVLIVEPEEEISLVLVIANKVVVVVAVHRFITLLSQLKVDSAHELLQHSLLVILLLLKLNLLG